jgi:hypothetical protein
MIRFLTTSVLYLLIHLLSAQDSSNTYHKNQIKFSPLTLLSDYSGLKLSYERMLNKKFSSQISGTYITDINKVSKDLKNRTGYAINFEQKYFIHNSNMTRFYLAADFDFLKCRYEDVLSFKSDSVKKGLLGNFNPSYRDSIVLERKMYTFGLKAGIQLLYKSFVLDFNFGLAFRNRDVKHFNRINPLQNLRNTDLPNFYYNRSVEGNYNIFYIPIGFKIGFAF